MKTLLTVVSIFSAIVQSSVMRDVTKQLMNSQDLETRTTRWLEMQYNIQCIIFYIL